MKNKNITLSMPASRPNRQRLYEKVERLAKKWEVPVTDAFFRVIARGLEALGISEGEGE
jgi:hypothetical protein